MLAVGADPATIREGGDSALDYLAARRADDGHYRYSATSDQTPVWVTGQVLTAVAGEAFPIPAVAREPRPDPAPASKVPRGTIAPPASGTGALPAVPESPGGSVVPDGVEPSPGAPPSGAAPLPGVPGAPGLEGAAPESAQTTPIAPPFEANEMSEPERLTPLGIGLGTGGIALGGVLFLGRRFGW